MSAGSLVSRTNCFPSILAATRINPPGCPSTRNHGSEFVSTQKPDLAFQTEVGALASNFVCSIGGTTADQLTLPQPAGTVHEWAEVRASSPDEQLGSDPK